MRDLLFKLYAYKPSPVGGIGYELLLSKAEIAMLRLLLASDESAFAYWQHFWQEIADYEDAPFGCKELMPLAVRKMQRAVSPEIWKSVAPSQATFLSGLPRYTWTKNRIIFQQFQALSQYLAAIDVPVMAIKGMAEMLRDPEVMFMRTSRDIDLVIQPKDLVKSVQLFQSMGWFSEQVANGIPFPLSQFDGNSFTFEHPDHFMSLDIHFDAVSDSRGAYMEFTQELWDTKINLAGYGGYLSIPSLPNQFCLFLANAFVPDNWSSGLVNKYLYDLLRQLQDMDGVAKKQAQMRAQQFLNMGDYARQIIRLSNQIDPIKCEPTKKPLVDKSKIIRRFKRGLAVTEDHYYQFWHKHDLYKANKPFLVKKYGLLFAYILILWDLIFQTRFVQVIYWRLITWKDQLIERLQYYFRRIKFYLKSDSVLNLPKKLSGKFFAKGTQQNSSDVTLKLEDMVVQHGVEEDLVAVVAEQSNHKLACASNQSPFPPGMSRHFYIAPKILKI